jgi:hypothetical protein
MAKHFDVTITGTTLAAERKQAQGRVRGGGV